MNFLLPAFRPVPASTSTLCPHSWAAGPGPCSSPSGVVPSQASLACPSLRRGPSEKPSPTPWPRRAGQVLPGNENGVYESSPELAV